MKSILLDPRSQRAANSPLELMTGPWVGPGLYLTDHKYPDPEQEIVSVSAGREGKKRSGPPVMGNRQIPVEIYVAGRRNDLASAPINSVTNPSFETDLTSWNLSAGGFTGAALSRAVMPSAAEDFGRGEFAARVNGTKENSGAEAFLQVRGNEGAGGLAVSANTDYVVSADVYAADAPVGVGGENFFLQLTWYTAGGALINGAQGGGTFIATGSSKRLTFAAKSPALAARCRVSVISFTATALDVVDFWVDAVALQKAAVATDYFDGDSPGSSWTGTAHGSTSTQPASAEEHFEAIVNDLERKLMDIREEGGTYSRPYRSGRLVFDLEGLAGGDDGDYDGRHWNQRGQKFGAIFDALPHGRGETKVGELVSQTTDPVMVMSVSNVGGSVRALGELEITDLAAVARRGLVGAFEVPEYDSTAETAALYYQAEKLTPMGASALAAVASATGAGSNTIQTVLEPVWRALASTKIAASGKHLTHIGTFRIFARIRQSGYVANGQLQYRLEWGQGDLIARTTNDVAVIVAKEAADWYLVDLGLVRIEAAKAGSQRWEGQIIGRSYDPAGSAYKPTSNIDDLRLVPVKDAYVRAAAPRTNLSSPTSYTNTDAFNQTAGSLNTKSADTGGVWATVNADGAAVTDFTVNASSHQLERTGTNVGNRIAVLPTSIAGSVLHRALVFPAIGSGSPTFREGIIVRYVDANNYLALLLEGTGGGTLSLSVAKWVAGVRTTLATKVLLTGFYLFLRYLGLFVGTSGYFQAFADSELIFTGNPVLEGYDAALAPGGSLASGKAGLSSYWSESNKGATSYDRLETWVPSESTLIASGRKLRWNEKGVQREDAAGGDQWSDVGYEGDPLLLPPSTKEGRAVRGILFPTRSDLENLPDGGNSDDFSARLTVTSRHLKVR